MARTRDLLIVAALVCTGGALSLRLPRTRTDLALFPGKPVYLYSFDDRGVGGLSKILALDRSDSGLRFSFVLGNTPTSYVGAGATWKGDGTPRSDEVDFGGWDGVELQLSASRPVRLRMSLVSMDSALWRPNDPLTRRYSEARFSPSSKGPTWIPLDRFQLAPWWIDRGAVPVLDTTRRLDRVQAVELQAVPGGQPADGRVDSVLVRSIRLVRSRHLVGAWIWLLPLVPGAVLALHLARERESRRILSSIPPRAVPVPPKPLPLRNESDELRDRLVAYLATHYHRSDLDADTVCRDTGIPRSRLPEILREGFGTGFKAYLNDLRMAEASRLLGSTDRSVSEIAFAVGYNGIAHFNRVFREKFGETPGEHRLARGPSEGDARVSPG